MAEDLIRRAADMLLGGATLLSQPCPYCTGVRVLKDGQALCVNCGREPKKRTDIPQNTTVPPNSKELLKDVLDKKVQSLSKELEKETDHKRQQDILNSLNSLLDALEKIKKR